MVSTPDGFIDNSPMSPRPSVTGKKPSARKSLCQFSEVLDVKQNNAVYRLFAANQSARQSDQVLCCGTVYQRV